LTPEGPARPHEALTASPGELGSHKTTPAQAQRTPSKLRCCLYPGARLRLEPPNSLLRLVRCKVPTDLFSHKRTKNGNGTGLLSQAGKRLPARPDGTAACGGLKPLSVNLLSRRSTVCGSAAIEGGVRTPQHPLLPHPLRRFAVLILRHLPGDHSCKLSRHFTVSSRTIFPALEQPP
jgi:hypothetical protein